MPKKKKKNPLRSSTKMDLAQTDSEQQNSPVKWKNQKTLFPGKTEEFRVWELKEIREKIKILARKEVLNGWGGYGS